LNLKRDILVSKFAFKCNSYRYNEVNPNCVVGKTLKDVVGVVQVERSRPIQ
jgi:hypothetical protein